MSSALFATRRGSLTGHIQTRRIFTTFMQDQRGFTLMELMVTLAIAAILMAFALPNYSAVSYTHLTLPTTPYV